MIDPASGPFLFDASAESWLARSRDPAVHDWLGRYLRHHEVNVSVVTIIERIRGYALLVCQRAAEALVARIRLIHNNAEDLEAIWGGWNWSGARWWFEVLFREMMPRRR